MSWIDLLLLVLASFRLTHLLVFDSIAKSLRSVLEQWSFSKAMITCYWCCGIWVAGALTLAAAIWPAGTRPVVVALAVAGGQALLETFVQRKPQ